MKRVSTNYSYNQKIQARDLLSKFGNQNLHTKEKNVVNPFKNKNFEFKMPKTQQNSHSKKANCKLNKEISPEFCNEEMEKNIIAKLIQNNEIKSNIKFTSPNKTFQSNVQNVIEIEPSTNRTQIDDTKSETNSTSFSVISKLDKSTKSVLISKNSEIMCNCGVDFQFSCCVKARKWLNILLLRKGISDMERFIRNYYAILESKIHPNDQNYIQIQKDSIRTFPSSNLFSPKSTMNQKLERILLAFSQYEPQVGYVQGLNFIVASILYHSSEEIAFWIFVSLFDDYDLRDIYQKGIPGIYKHTQILDIIIFDKFRELYSYLVFLIKCKHNIKIEMIVIDWIFTLFTTLVPLEDTYLIIDNFLKEGWIFFYKLVVKLLENHQAEILKANDLDEILKIMRYSNKIHGMSKLISYIPLVGNKFLGLYWKDLINSTDRVKLDEINIKKMHEMYDNDTLNFKIQI